jgi:putative Mn2+ efflux pump MntP
MGIISIFLIAIGLNFDSLAVSISAGLVIKDIRFRQAIRIAFVFAFFQGLMPLLGWFIGTQIRDLIKDYDHWISFALLFLIGAKMIYESFKKEEDKSPLNPLKLIVMTGMAVATSIDALVVGVSFAFIDVNIIISIAIIGSMTFIVAMLGMLLGKKAGGLFGKKMEIVGGLILIGIGLKILIEHTSMV